MSRYLFSVLEQALWSLLNFGVNLLLIRFVAPEQYGAFVFWASCGFVLSSLQNALTVCHLQVLAPGDGLAPARLSVERLMGGVNLVFLLIVALACLGAAVAWRVNGSPYGAVAAALFTPAYLLQQYMRALTFSRGRQGVAVVQTGAVFLLVVILLGQTLVAHQTLDANAILMRMGLAYAVCGIASAIWTGRGQGGMPGLRALAAYGDYARQSGWVFLGVSSTELLARFYVFVVAGWFGPAALAALAATQQLLRPIPLLASSWSMVARNDLAKRRDLGQWRGFSRVVAIAVLGGAIIAATWTLCVWAAWPLVAGHLFSGKYADDGWMVLLWGLGGGIAFGQTVVSAALQVLRAFKPLALANAAASLVAAGAILVLMRMEGPAGAIVGTAAGQLLELVVMTAILTAAVRARAAARPAET